MTFLVACSNHCPSRVRHSHSLPAILDGVTSTRPCITIQYQTKVGGKVGLQLWVCKQSLFLYYYLLFCIVFPMNNCKPTFAPPCIWWWWWCQCPQTFQLWTIFLLKFQTFISICTQLSWALKMDVYKIQILIFFPNQVLDSLFHSVNGNSILPVIREEK